MNPQLPHQTDFCDLVVQHPEDGRKSATQTYSPQSTVEAQKLESP